MTERVPTRNKYHNQQCLVFPPVLVVPTEKEEETEEKETEEEAEEKAEEGLVVQTETGLMGEVKFAGYSDERSEEYHYSHQQQQRSDVMCGLVMGSPLDLYLREAEVIRAAHRMVWKRVSDCRAVSVANDGQVLRVRTLDLLYIHKVECVFYCLVE